MTDDVEIVNLALAHLGQARVISSLNEATAEAIASRRYLEHAKKIVLTHSDWGFASVRTPLALLNAPYGVWEYAYAIPANNLFIHAVLYSQTTGGTNDPRPQPYIIESDAIGQKRILTRVANAEVRYTTSAVTDYPVAVADALSFCLAYYLCAGLIATDISKAEMWKRYIESLGIASQIEGRQQRIEEWAVIAQSTIARMF